MVTRVGEEVDMGIGVGEANLAKKKVVTGTAVDTIDKVSIILGQERAGVTFEERGSRVQTSDTANLELVLSLSVLAGETRNLTTEGETDQVNLLGVDTVVSLELVDEMSDLTTDQLGVGGSCS